MASRLPRRLRGVVKASAIGAFLSRIKGRPRRPGPPSGALRPVVYLPTWARWDVMRQRPQYLLAAFAKAGHQVYFVDQQEKRPRRADGVHIVPWISQTPRRGVILYTHFAPVRELFDRFDDAVVVYDILDDLSIYDADEAEVAAERRVAAHHGDLVRQADVVTVSSDVLADKHRDERAELVVVPNGVDVAAFERASPAPTDLRSDGRPIVGYHGAMSYWFDFELVGAVADEMSDVRFVLIGPVDDRAANAVHVLQKRPNVEMLGERPPAAIPPYVKCFDAGVIPFLVTDMTSGVSPLKLYEFLAAGVPCVATPLPACVASPTTRTAAGPAGFVAALREALAGDDDFASRARGEAVSADWGRRIRPLLDRLDDSGLRRA